MSTEHEHKLQCTQRRMLRWIVGVGRRKQGDNGTISTNSSDSSSETDLDEPSETDSENQKLEVENWIDWIRRSTHISEIHAERAGVVDWVQAQRMRKWRLAGHIARRTDARWSTKLLHWMPDGTRGVGRPRRRWDSSLAAFVQAAFNDEHLLWTDVAQDRETWQQLEGDFVQRAWNR